MLPPAPCWAVPVRVPFLVLVLSGACDFKTAWLLSRGALVSPLDQKNILQKVRSWRGGRLIDSEKSRRRLHFLSSHAPKRSWRGQLRHFASKASSEAVAHLPRCFC